MDIYRRLPAIRASKAPALADEFVAFLRRVLDASRATDVLEGRELDGGLMALARVWTRSAPEGDDGGERDGRGVVAGQLVVAGGDTTEILEAIEGGLDAPAFAVAALVVADLPLAAALAWDDRRDALSPQVGSEPIGVVALVGGQATDPTGSLSEHGWGGGNVAGVARRQQEDAGAAEDIGEDVDLGRLAPARRADALRTSPPLPPCAERCALT